MNIIVQKFGGTSVNSEANREYCKEKIKNTLKNNYKVVVVVSAMGRNGDPYSTDSLINLTSRVTNREKDLLMNSGEIISACVFSDNLKKRRH